MSSKTENNSLTKLNEIKRFFSSYDRYKRYVDENYNYTYRKDSIRKKLFKENHPIIIMFTADWHIGSKYTEHEELRKDIENVVNINPEFLRIIILGDIIDNCGKNFKVAEDVQSLMPISIQKKFIKDIILYLMPYIDFISWGNHDIEWDEKNIGYSDLKDFFDGLNKDIFLPGPTLVEYSFKNFSKKKNIKYLMYLSHLFKGNSWFHGLHGNIRAWLETKADLVVCGHDHEYGYLTDNRGSVNNNTERHLIRLGSYKNDYYGKRYFNNLNNKNYNSYVILFNNSYKLIRFSDIKDVITYMRGLNYDILK